MQLEIWQIDAFANHPFEGNPAAVIPLEFWPDDKLLQSVALENNLSETAFFVQNGPGKFHLRWFTPQAEVPLCGHATLASAWLILNILYTEFDGVCFDTCSGPLFVSRESNGRLCMSLPVLSHTPTADESLAAEIGSALKVPPPKAVLTGKKLMAVWDNPAIIRALPGPGDSKQIILATGTQGLIVTAPGDQGYDFLSRYFAPNIGIPEDPVTGSAHCMLVPYWAKRLKKPDLRARQVSPRGGDIRGSLSGERVILRADCCLYMRGQISI